MGDITRWVFPQCLPNCRKPSSFIGWIKLLLFGFYRVHIEVTHVIVSATCNFRKRIWWRKACLVLQSSGFIFKTQLECRSPFGLKLAFRYSFGSILLLGKASRFVLGCTEVLLRRAFLLYKSGVKWFGHRQLYRRFFCQLPLSQWFSSLEN